MCLYLLRGVAICLFSRTTDTLQKRIWLGTELWKEEAIYLETNIAFWTAIAFLYLHFSFTSSPLDYTFLALYRMADSTHLYLEYTLFDLSLVEYTQFAQFRHGALLLFNFINVNLFSLTPLCLSFGYYQTGLLMTNPFWSLLWMMIVWFLAVGICTILYGNLIAFIVVVKYLYLKQKFIARRLHWRLVQLKMIRLNGQGSLLWGAFLSLNLKYSHLYAEMAEYLLFWSSYLSLVFVFYVMIITYMMYIVLFSTMALYYKAIMSLGLVVHILLLTLIIHYCGKIVALNGSLASKVSFQMTPQLGKSHRHTAFSFGYLLKVNNIANYLAINSSSGVSLLNGYTITFDTFRLLFLNITLYFILFLKD